MQQEKLQQLSNGLQLLGNPVRLKIFEHLLANRKDDEPTMPTIVASELDMKLPSVSHHLKRMHEAGLLHRKRRGRYTFYWTDVTFMVLVWEFFK